MPKKKGPRSSGKSSRRSVFSEDTTGGGITKCGRGFDPEGSAPKVLPPERFVLEAAAFRICSEVSFELLVRAAPDLADEVTRGLLGTDTVVAAADSAFVTNPQMTKLLSDLRSESARDPAFPGPPLPLLRDYAASGASPTRLALDQILLNFRDHFSLGEHLASRAFRRNLGALRRALSPTEAALIKGAARAWWEDAPADARWEVQGALLHSPETVVGVALGVEPLTAGGRRPVLALYNTDDARRFLRLVVAKEAELMEADETYHQASVVAATSIPEVFASLRFRRRAYLLVSEAPARTIARAASLAVAELAARRTARRERVVRNAEVPPASTADSTASWRSSTARSLRSSQSFRDIRSRRERRTKPPGLRPAQKAGKGGRVTRGPPPGLATPAPASTPPAGGRGRGFAEPRLSPGGSGAPLPRSLSPPVRPTSD